MRGSILIFSRPGRRFIVSRGRLGCIEAVQVSWPRVVLRRFTGGLDCVAAVHERGGKKKTRYEDTG